jgi:copper chaperone CopZ
MHGKISVMKNKIINLALVLAIIVIWLFLPVIRVMVTPDSVAALRTSDMTCGSCEAESVKFWNCRQVASADVNVAAGKVTVWYDSHAVQPEILAGKLTEIGYGSSLLVIMPVEKFMAMTGKTGGTRASAKGSWCSGCCAK